MARFMMCPPKYFAIEYEINPWMSRLHGSNPDLANAQWQHLVNIIRDECGAQIDLIEPQPGLPDLVFTANAGLIIDQQVVLSRFRFPVRTGEEPVFNAWFKSAGIEVLRLAMIFSSKAPAMPCFQETNSSVATIFAARSPRTTPSLK